MAAIYLPDTAKGCISAVRLIRDYCNTLRNADAAMPLDRFQALCLSMRDSDTQTLAPLLAQGTQAQVNAILGRFIVGWGADPHTALTSIRTASAALRVAARTVMNSSGSPTVDASGNVVWPDVPLSSIQTLNSALDGVLAAIAVIEG